LLSINTVRLLLDRRFLAMNPPKQLVLQKALHDSSIHQNLLNGYGAYSHINTKEIRTLTFHEKDLSNGIMKRFVEYQGPIGISGGYHPDNQSLRALAIAGEDRCLIVEFGSGKADGRDAEDGREKLMPVLTRPAGLFAFDLGPLSMALYGDLGLRISNGIDIQSAFPEEQAHRRKSPLNAIKACIGDHCRVNDNNIGFIFEDLSYDRSNPRWTHSTNHICQRAWISQFLPLFENGVQAFDQVPKIDTASLPTVVSPVPPI
jgi:hypothetical protein